MYILKGCAPTSLLHPSFIMKAALFVYISLAMLVVYAIPVRIARTGTETDTNASYTQKWYRRDEVDSEAPFANGKGGKWWARAESSDLDSDVPYAGGEGGSWWARGE